MSLVAAMSREEMLHCHYLHGLAEAVNSPTLFQSLTVLEKILYTAGLPSLTLKHVLFCFCFSRELRYVVLVLEAFDGPWSNRPLVPDRSDVVPTPPKKEKPSFRWK